MYEIKNINKEYIKKDKRRNHVLKNINLKLPNKGFISIIGESGSGKTTFLNLLGLLEKPTSGEIFINDNKIDYNSRKDLEQFRNENISFIFQDSNLINDLSVYDNLIIAGEKDKDVINKYLNKFLLDDVADTKVRYLSGGEKQRLSIIRGIIRKSKILLVDEPTGNLDYNNTKNIFSLLKEVSKEVLVIVVSHDLKNINLYADYIYDISKNKIVKKDEKLYKAKNENHRLSNAKPYFPFKYIFKYTLTLFRLTKIRTIVSLFLLLLSLFLVFMHTNTFFSKETNLIYHALIDEKEKIMPVYNKQINETDEKKLDIKNGKYLYNKLSKLENHVIPYFISDTNRPRNDNEPRINLVTFVIKDEEINNIEENIDGKIPNNIDEIVLTDFMCEYIFGNKEVLDKELEIKSSHFGIDQNQKFKIVGVIKTEKTNKSLLRDFLDNEKFYDRYRDDLFFKYAISYISKSTYENLYNKSSLKLYAANFFKSEEYTRSYATYYSSKYALYDNQEIIYGEKIKSKNEVIVSTNFLAENEIENHNDVLGKTFSYKDLNESPNWKLYQHMNNLYDINQEIKIVGIIDDSNFDVLVSKEFYNEIIKQQYFTLDGFVLKIKKEKLITSLNKLRDNNIFVGYDFIRPIYDFSSLKEGIFFNILLFLEMIFIIISTLVLTLHSSNNISSRNKEICIMKSLGIRPKKIVSIFLIFNLLLAAISSIIAIIFGIISNSIINNILRGDDIMFRFDLIRVLPIGILIITITSIIISIFSVLIPFIKINKMDLGILLKDSI